MTPFQTHYCEIDFPHPAQKERLVAIFDNPECILTATTISEVPGLLSQVEAHAKLGCWVIGFVSYEAAGAFDKALRVYDDFPLGLPFAQFAVYRTIATIPRHRGEHINGPWRDPTTIERFDTSIAQIKHNISKGNYYQVNYTTRLETPFLGDGLSFFDRLKASQPSAYCSYMDFGDWKICSVSPELFFYCGADEEEGRILTCRPMKGTATRHADSDEDLVAARKLKISPKERAENLMIVDLVRNDMSRVARPNSIDVPHLFSVEAWPTVWQMTSTITCRMKKGKELADVFRALFPCGSVTGAPKAAAMSAIKGLEPSPRGVYCGAVGVVMPGGEALFSVGIRTPVIYANKAIAVCGIGSGITMDSEGTDEYAEWHAKQRFLLRSCHDYELLETIRMHQGRFWLLDRHLKRIERSTIELGFRFDAKLVNEQLKKAAEQYKKGQWRLRLRLSASGKICTDVLPLDKTPGSVHIAMAKSPIDSENPWLGFKTTRRDVYSTKASKQAGVFDTLLFNERDELTEFTRGNLVIELQGRLITPTATCGLLPGVLRGVLLDRKRIQEGIVTVNDLVQATHIWFVNSVRGVVLVKHHS